MPPHPLPSLPREYTYTERSTKGTKLPSRPFSDRCSRGRVITAVGPDVATTVTGRTIRGDRKYGNNGGGRRGNNVTRVQRRRRVVETKKPVGKRTKTKPVSTFARRVTRTFRVGVPVKDVDNPSARPMAARRFCGLRRPRSISPTPEPSAAIQRHARPDRVPRYTRAPARPSVRLDLRRTDRPTVRPTSRHGVRHLNQTSRTQVVCVFRIQHVQRRRRFLPGNFTRSQFKKRHVAVCSGAIVFVFTIFLRASVRNRHHHHHYRSHHQ